MHEAARSLAVPRTPSALESRLPGTVIAVLALLALVATLLAGPLAQPADAQPIPDQPTWSCEDPNGYLFQEEPIDVIQVNLVTGADTRVGDDIYSSGAGSNAWGYNRTDNFIWGRENGAGGQLIRLGSDYSAEPVTIPGLGAVAATHNGDIDANGVYHIKHGGATVYRIDLNPASPNYLTLLPALTLSRATDHADIMFSPVDGMMYGVESDETLVRINPATGQVTDVGTVTTTPAADTVVGIGAGFADRDGNIYLSQNSTGNIYVIEEPHTGNVAATRISVGPQPTGGGNDGARCATAPSVLEPSLSVAKTSDFTGSEIAVGDEIDYTITVTNTGNVTIDGINVTDPLIPDLDCTPAAPGALGPGDVQTCEGTYTVTEADAVEGSVENTATAQGNDPDGNPIEGEGSITVPAEGPAGAVVVTKSSDHDGSDLAVGDEITYTIVGENTGNVTATGVDVTDPLIPDLDCTPATPATLGPDAQIVCEGTYTITQDDVDDGEVVNTATVTGTDPTGDPIEGEGSTTVPGPEPRSELSVDKASNSDGSPIELGEEYTYTIVVENTGNVTATDVDVSDPLIPDLDCTPATPRALVPGEQIVCEGTYTITQDDVDDGEVVNTATVTGTDPSGDPIEGEGSTTVPGPEPRSELSVEKSSDFSGSTIELGDEITYTIVVENTGNVTANGAQVSDPLIADLECDLPTPRILVPGAQLVCEGTYTVTEDDVEAGSVVNTAEATAVDPEGDPIHGEGSTTVPAVPEVVRLGGPSRTDTAIEISQDSFDDGDANVVLLARDDVYADALSGTPLGVAEDGPILLTRTDELLPAVADEIRRVLGDDGRVYLLGGEVALNADVWDQTMELGYDQMRLSGPSRIETAIDVATHLGEPELTLLATGWEFADALTAAAAAGANGGAVLLTPADTPHAAVDDYLSGLTPDLYAVGGPAVRAYPAAEPVLGPTRDTTAVAVAETFFDAPQSIAFARMDDFPDALTGGRHIADRGGPLLLTATQLVPDSARDYACGLETVRSAYIYGGEVAVSAGVFDDISGLIINGEGCG